VPTGQQDGHRILVRREGGAVRLYSRNAYDWTVRLASIAAAAELITAKSFTIDGEAVVLGPMVCHGSRSCAAERQLEPRLRDLIELDGEDLRNLAFLDGKAALARLLRNTKTANPA
jgi:bifunctional non-homologous end joining protein LigD